MDHTPFIVGSYAAFAILIAIDVVVPWLQRRQLLRELRGRLTRQRKRETP